MPALVSQRCLNHSTREAVARCPECGCFYCRECVTEHDDRIICASCLKKLAQQAEAKPRRKLNLWPAFQGLSGVFLACFVFYVIGRILLAIPTEYHNQAIWKLGWLSDLGSDSDD